VISYFEGEHYLIVWKQNTRQDIRIRRERNN